MLRVKWDEVVGLLPQGVAAHNRLGLALALRWDFKAWVSRVCAVQVHFVTMKVMCGQP